MFSIPIFDLVSTARTTVVLAVDTGKFTVTVNRDFMLLIACT